MVDAPEEQELAEKGPEPRETATAGNGGNGRPLTAAATYELEDSEEQVRGAEEDLEVREKRKDRQLSRLLAVLLVSMLGASFLLHYVCTLFVVGEKAQALASIYGVWLPVVSGLAGSAVAYYFSKEKSG